MTDENRESTMTKRESLRTRIAALIYDTVAWRSVNVPVAEEVADAVIRELQIEAEDGECGYCHAMLPGCRYSTWKADDE